MSNWVDKQKTNENFFFKNELNFIEREQKQMEKYNNKQVFDCNYNNIADDMIGLGEL